jgi:hypothetical protein
LSEWPGTDLPSDFAPRGIVVDRSISPALVCVYGNAVLCFDSVWNTQIALDPTLEVNDLAIGDLHSIAVGTHGRNFMRRRDPGENWSTWTEAPRLGDNELTSASTQGDKAVALGSTGQFVTLDVGSAPPISVSCSLADRISMVDLHRGNSDQITAVTSSGRVLRHDSGAPSNELCQWEQSNVGQILGGTINPCGISDNERVFSAQKVVGFNICAQD